MYGPTIPSGTHCLEVSCFSQPFPFFLQLWVFQPHTHHLASSSLNRPLKGYMERGGTDVGGGGGVPMCMEMSHPSMFLPHLLAPSLKQAAPEGQLCTAAISLHCCIFATYSSLCHSLFLL